MKRKDIWRHWEVQFLLGLGPDDRPLGPPTSIGPFTGPKMGTINFNPETGDLEIKITKEEKEDDSPPAS